MDGDGASAVHPRPGELDRYIGGDIDAQKKLLDVAAQQLKVSAKTAKEAIGAINLLPAETLGELARHTVEGLVESEQDLLNVIVKPPREAPKAHAATEHPKPSAAALPVSVMSAANASVPHARVSSVTE